MSLHNQGVWESRTVNSPSGLAQAEDQGTMWPLTLPAGLAMLQASTETVSPQKLVIAWRGQAVTHAAVVLPELVILQICRFSPSGNKDFTRVKLSDSVYLPVFTGPGLNTSSVRYSVTAIIYHLGLTPQSGHYRTALVERGRLCYHTDDNEATTVHQPEHTDRVEQNSYLYFLRKCG